MDATTIPQHRFYSTKALMRWTAVGLSIAILLSTIKAVFFLFYLNLGAEGVLPTNSSPWDMSMRMFFNMSWVSMLASFAATVLFFFWIYRAQANLEWYGAEDLEYTPRWAVLWFLFPVAFLWMPYCVMRDLLKASTEPRNWKQQTISSTLPILWGLNVLFVLVGFSLAVWTLVNFATIGTYDSIHKAARFFRDFSEVPLFVVTLYVMIRVQALQNGLSPAYDEE